MDADAIFLAMINTTINLKKDKFHQWELAQRINVNPGVLCKYLRGRRPMPLSVKEKLIVVLGLDKTFSQASPDTQQLEATVTKKVVNKKEVNTRKSAAGGR
jgi:hypothetical protein